MAVSSPNALSAMSVQSKALAARSEQRAQTRSVRRPPPIAKSVRKDAVKIGVFADGGGSVIRSPLQAAILTFSTAMRQVPPPGFSQASTVWQGPYRLLVLPQHGWPQPSDGPRRVGPFTCVDGQIVQAVDVRFHIPDPTLPRVVWFGPTQGRTIYLTIDDGWIPDPASVEFLSRHHIPFTTFLVGKAALLHPAFFSSVDRLEGFLGDHTMTHPSLLHLSPHAIESQVIACARVLETLGAPPPTWFRPPYGAYNHEVLRALGNAGIRTVVMWSAVASQGVVTTYDGGPLAPGDVVLLHWTPDLRQNLAVLWTIALAEHLRFGRLPGVPTAVRLRSNVGEAAQGST